MATHRYTVPGMHCGGCRKTIESAIKAVDSDAVVVANTDDKSVTVESTIDPGRLRGTIEAAGYEVRDAASRASR